MKKRICLFILLTVILTMLSGCNRERIIHVYSPDKLQCITIISDYNFRYVINGKHSSVPDTNYVKVDLSKMDRLGDGIAGCWRNENYEWLIRNDETIIVENKLDTTKYQFFTSYPVDEQGIPTLKDFVGNGCYNFDFGIFSLVPKEGAIIELQ